MDRERLVRIIEEESATLLATAVAALDSHLVFYPEWTMVDLLVHTGSVHRRTTRIVAERLVERTDRVYPPDEDPAAVPAWFGDGYREMVEVLAAADPEMAVWGFGRDPTVRTWLLRMALETALHRWDAQRAAGDPAPLPADLAAAGIEEFGWMQRPALPADCPYSGDLMALRATDDVGSWMIAVVEDRFRMRRSDGTGVCAASGSASDLYLWLLGRDAGGVDTDGDGAAVAWWEAAVAASPAAAR